LRDLRGCHGDTLSFMEGMFEEFSRIGEALNERRQCLAQMPNEGDSVPAGGQEISDDRWSQLLAEKEAERRELKETRETVQKQVARLATVAVELATAQNEFQADFQSIREEMAKNREAFSFDPPSVPMPNNANCELELKLCDLERQHVMLEQDRAVLEKELESVRNRASELAESLADQKRQAVQQQSQWTLEIQRMRSLLEALVRQTHTSEIDHPAKASTASSTADAGSDPALDSVLAQFEMLQQDRVRRRA
jgi:hypothetical protein